MWHDQYLSGIEAKRAPALERLEAFIEHQVRINPAGKPFVCVCGAVTADPLAPEFEAEHRPHVFLAGQERLRQQRG